MKIDKDTTAAASGAAEAQVRADQLVADLVTAMAQMNKPGWVPVNVMNSIVTLGAELKALRDSQGVNLPPDVAAFLR